MKVFGVLFGLIFLAGSAFQVVKMLEVTPDQSLAKAESLMLANKLPEALAEAEQAAAKAPKDERFWVLQANLQLKLSGPEKALPLFEKALSINPNSVLAHEAVAVIYANKRDWVQAEKHLLAALKVEDKNGVAHNNLGVIYLEQKQPTKAEAAFQKAIKVDPRNGDSYRNLGALYRQQGDRARSDKYLMNYLKLFPKAPDAEEIRAVLRKSIQTEATPKPNP
ncbi:MAG: tetratricopeptide repeat protein [Candidatus Sericytochromatia bacterium]